MIFRETMQCIFRVVLDPHSISVTCVLDLSLTPLLRAGHCNPEREEKTTYRYSKRIWVKMGIFQSFLAYCTSPDPIPTLCNIIILLHYVQLTSQKLFYSIWSSKSIFWHAHTNEYGYRLGWGEFEMSSVHIITL